MSRPRITRPRVISFLIGKNFVQMHSRVYFLPIMVYALHEVIRVNLISVADCAAKWSAAERKMQLRGGIYHKLQVDMTYNSNHIEGSRLTHRKQG